MLKSHIKPKKPKKNIITRILGKAYRELFENPRRESIKNRFLQMPASKQADAELDFTLHMMVCKRDLKMAVCSIFAANLFCDRAFRWVLHDDGSLDDLDENLLFDKVPASLVKRRKRADTHAETVLNDYPEILEYRRQQIMALKLIDVRLWGDGDKIGYVDSDVLFVNTPEFFLDALINKNPKNYFNKDIQNAYVKTPDEIEELIGVRPFEKGNAGLWVMHREDINLDKIEEWLKHTGFSDKLYAYTLDQTFINMLASLSPHGVEHFPKGYDVDLNKSLNQAIDKHYVGVIRHGYELEGLHYLLNNKAFEMNWEQFVKN